MKTLAVCLFLLPLFCFSQTRIEGKIDVIDRKDNTVLVSGNWFKLDKKAVDSLYVGKMVWFEAVSSKRDKRKNSKLLNPKIW